MALDEMVNIRNELQLNQSVSLNKMSRVYVCVCVYILSIY